jgi:acetyl-CoA carboxylase carboxyl transferase subunit alpha
MSENAIYSVISPEGCAGILWRDGSKAAEAAEALKITAVDLAEKGVIDEIVKEPKGGAHKNKKSACTLLKKAIVKNLKDLSKISISELLERRYAKFCSFGRTK